MTWRAFLAGTVILTGVLGCESEVTAQRADVSGQASAGGPSFETRAAALLERLDRQPGAAELRRELITLCDEIYAAPVDVTSGDRSASGALLERVNAFALAGDAESLRALMRAALGPYGRTTAEGQQWLNELLWRNLEADAQQSLDSLAALPDAQRDVLVAEIYLSPIHDGFDFRKIERSIASSPVPESLADVVPGILAVVSGY